MQCSYTLTLRGRPVRPPSPSLSSHSSHSSSHSAPVPHYYRMTFPEPNPPHPITVPLPAMAQLSSSPPYSLLDDWDIPSPKQDEWGNLGNDWGERSKSPIKSWRDNFNFKGKLNLGRGTYTTLGNK
ncbi:hypothetical protein FHG87_017992, partial [Trinorchestia longiramus]